MLGEEDWFHTAKLHDYKTQLVQALKGEYAIPDIKKEFSVKNGRLYMVLPEDNRLYLPNMARFVLMD